MAMLSAYPTVYFKPTDGSGGKNIIRIQKRAKGFQMQFKAVKSSFSTLNLLYDNLQSFSRHRPFLLQRGIPLARTNGNPFDIRVMIQKTDGGVWKCTAVFTKIGKSGMVATNYNQGGRIGFFQQTMAGAGYDKDSIKRMEARLEELGVTVGGIFDQRKTGFRELGLDVALSSSGRPWILEVNTRPQFYPLKNMKDKRMYNRILSYAKFYGRYK